MKVFVMGSTGATGRHLVRQLLERGIYVSTVVRSIDKLLKVLDERQIPRGMEVLEDSILDMDRRALSMLLSDCDAAASCLGHNLSLHGIFGPPRYLVTESVRLVCETIMQQDREGLGVFRFILMNTSGNLNPDERERRRIGEEILTGIIRLMIPPHRDNEHAAEYLRGAIGRFNPLIEWAAVRPDSLVDADSVTEYMLQPSPIRSPLFNPGRTSRINVANFMARLADDMQLWESWCGRMPVIYNEDKVGELVG